MGKNLDVDAIDLKNKHVVIAHAIGKQTRI
jgi:hypothetical protein